MLGIISKEKLKMNGMKQPNLPIKPTPQFLWEEVRQQIWEGLDSSSKNEAWNLASLCTPVIYKSVKSGTLPLIWELQDSQIAPPKSLKECQALSLSMATWLEFICENYLGVTASIAAKALEKELLPLFQRWEHPIESSERNWEQITDWLNTRLRTFVGSLVELYFGRYKHYHALPPYKQELLLGKLEKAGVKAALQSFYRISSDEASISEFFPDFLPRCEEKMEILSSKFSCPDTPNLEGFVASASFTFDLILEFTLKLSAQLSNPHSNIREKAEECIRSSIGEACKSLVEEVERYDSDFDERRLGDPHLQIIRFNPPDALCWGIILEYKEKKHTAHGCSMKELARRNGMDVRLIYNFARRIKYQAQVDLIGM